MKLQLVLLYYIYVICVCVFFSFLLFGALKMLNLPVSARLLDPIANLFTTILKYMYFWKFIFTPLMLIPMVFHMFASDCCLSFFSHWIWFLATTFNSGGERKIITTTAKYKNIIKWLGISFSLNKPDNRVFILLKIVELFFSLSLSFFYFISFLPWFSWNLSSIWKLS